MSSTESSGPTPIGHKLHALIAKFLIQLLQPRQVTLHDRARGIREHKHKRPLGHGILVADEIARAIGAESEYR